MSTDHDQLSAQLAPLLAQITALTTEVFNLRTASLDSIEAERQLLEQPVPIEEWRDYFFAHRWPNGCDSKYTIPTYRSTWDAFVPWVHEHDGLVTTPIIRNFCARPRDRAPKPMPNTFNRDRNALAGSLKFLVNNRSESGCHPIYYAQALAVQTRPTGDQKGKEPANPPTWKLLWLSELPYHQRFWLGMLYYGGLRRWEVSEMRVAEIDTRARKLVQIRRKGPGETRGDVPYGLMADLMAKHVPGAKLKLDDWYESIDKVLADRDFGDPTEVHACYRWEHYAGSKPENRDGWLNKDLEKLLVSLGEPKNAFSPHHLRHSCNTNLSLIKGLDPAHRRRWLNHKDARTNDIYTGSVDDEIARQLL